MVPKIERVTEHVQLGEGPHWDEKTQSLYYVDVFGKSILKYTPKTNKLTKASTEPFKTSLIVPVQDQDDRFVVTLNDELALISWDGVSDKIIIEETLAKASDGKSGLSFNDGKCDSLGRLWAGTLGSSTTGDIFDIPAVGVLYTLDSKRKLVAQSENISLTNGLAFNDKLKLFYHIDSKTATVYQFDFDLKNGSITNKKPHFTFKQHDTPGFPDGMTIDTDGNLWVAAITTGRVLKIDGSKPEVLLQTIQLPALQVTSVTFGGANLDELYATTGSIPFLNVTNLETPTDGALYKITETGSRGLPNYSFKL